MFTTNSLNGIFVINVLGLIHGLSATHTIKQGCIKMTLTCGTFLIPVLYIATTVKLTLHI